MPLSIDDEVYELKMHGVVITSEFLNVFHYGGSDPLTDVGTLADAFITAVVPALQLIMHNSTIIDRVDVGQVKGGNAFASRVVSAPGLVSTDALPPFVAWDFTYQRAGLGERNGYKRIPGVGESMQNAGVATATYRILADGVAAAFAADLTAEANLFSPLIKRTVVHHVPQIPPVYYTVGGVSYSRIGSQNSRKFGHGR